MKKITRTALAVGFGLVPALGLATVPAHAQAAREAVSIDDPADATGAGIDILEVGLDHTSTGLVAEIEVADLRRDASAGLSFFVDVDRARKGPELVLTGGLFEGTDYVLLKAKGWNDTVGEPLTCTHRMRLRYVQDVVKVKIGADCLDGADRLKVALTTADDSDPSHPVVDWLGRSRHWTPWVGNA